jgi:thioredoxin 1
MTTSINNIPLINDDQEFNNLLKAFSKVAVLFSAVWCAPCKKITPVFSSLMFKHPNIKMVKTDVDSSDIIVNEYDISQLPSVLLFRNGSVVKRLTGSDEAQLINAIDDFSKIETPPSIVRTYALGSVQN